MKTYGSRIKLKTTNSESKLPLKRLIKQQPNKTGPSVWVKKWVDYSSKYGLGYLLSNGATGVYFNDNTKLLKER